jgi:hypothetical protein
VRLTRIGDALLGTAGKKLLRVNLTGTGVEDRVLVLYGGARNPRPTPP